MNRGPQVGGFDQGGFGGGDRGAFGGGFDRGSQGFGGNADGFRGGNFGGQAPSRSQLGSFLGMPSDGGMGAVSNSSRQSSNYSVNHGSVDGPRGGSASGTTVTGPQGNTVAHGSAEGARGGEVSGTGVKGADGGAAARGVAVGPDGGVAAGGVAKGPDGGAAARGVVKGPDGGVAAGSAVKGPDGGAAARGVAVGPDGGAVAGGAVRSPDGGAAARGVAVGPDGRVAAGGAVRGPDGGAAARGVVAGPYGAAGGFAYRTPSNIYGQAYGVRAGFAAGGLYSPGWYNDHPGAWAAAGVTAAAWTAASWGAMSNWCGYSTEPVYYNYGSNVVTEGDNVYVDNQDVGTSQEYYQQASDLATSGAQAATSDGENWLPLGVFVMTPADQNDTNMTIQLAVSKQGVIRGNFTDTKLNKTMLVQGSVDKETQRAAWTIGDNKDNVMETGVYNLTKDEAPALLHLGADKTQQWLLVRVKQDAQSQSSQ